MIESQINTKLKLFIQGVLLQSNIIHKIMHNNFLYDDRHRTIIKTGFMARQYIGDYDDTYEYFFLKN